MDNVNKGAQLLDADNILKNVVRLDYKSKVADLGCGAMAHFTTTAARLVGNEGQVYSVDIRKEVLSSVQSKAEVDDLKNIKTVWSNLEILNATKVPENMDYVFLVAVLFQNKEHLQILLEAGRLLKVGGKLLIVEWLPKKTSLGPIAERRLDPEYVKQVASQANLKLEQEFTASPQHYGLIFIK